MIAPRGAVESRMPSVLRHVDWALVASAAVIAAIGLVLVYSATEVRLHGAGLDPTIFVKRQAAWVALGIATMIGVASVDYRVFRDTAPMAYAAVVVGLVAVLSPLGSSARGSQRWFALGPFQLQPSAFAVLALIVTVAALCHNRRDELEAVGVGTMIVVAVVLMGLVAIQPDLGTALVLGVVLLALLVAVGTPPRYLAFLLVAGVTVIVLVVQAGLLKQYQVSRVTAFLDQSHDVRQTTYNLEQSKIAIASGGLTGKGLFHGTQTNLSYVPEQHTDFIFTAVGEELGFVGAFVLLALFALLAWRVWQAALTARDPFGTFVCVGVLAYFAFEMFENVGMTMGIMPITGIPLPLVSYGGSSTVVAFAAIGLVLGVRMRRFA